MVVERAISVHQPSIQINNFSSGLEVNLIVFEWIDKFLLVV